MSQNKTLRNILKAVYKMAVRKRNANLNRAEGEKYAEMCIRDRNYGNILKPKDGGLHL